MTRFKSFSEQKFPWQAYLILSIVVTVLTQGCAQKQLIRENASGPTFTAPFLPGFLKSALNTGMQEGPLLLTVSTEVPLSDGTSLPEGAEIYGYFVTRGNKVLYAPAFAKITGEDGERRIPINSYQTGRVALTPSSSRYLKEAGKSAAIVGTVGAAAGAVVGAKEGGVGGALLGALIGAAAGAAAGAGTSAAGLWLGADVPVTLPAGSGLVIHLQRENE